MKDDTAIEEFLTEEAASSSGRARDYSIASVDRAMDLLEALARIGPAPLARLADEAGCTRTAAFRLLRTLQSRGFAIQDQARGIWRMGARWGVLGRAASTQGALAATAQPILVDLSAATGENSYIRVREGLQSETIALNQFDPALPLYAQISQRRPLHAGGSRLLLAYAPDNIQTQVLTQRLPRFTPATRTAADWIAADLQRIRQRGYLMTSDEVTPGAIAICAPVNDASGQVVAVISVMAATLRMRPPRTRTVLAEVQKAAAALSGVLGFRPPPLVAEPSAKPAQRVMLRSA